MPDKSAQDDGISLLELVQRRLFDLSPESILVFKPDAEVVAVNSVACKLTGYERGAMEGVRLDRLPFIQKEHSQMALENFMERVEGKEIKPYNFPIKTKKGKVVVGRINGGLIKNEDGEVVGVLILVTDVTEEARVRKVAERNQNFLKSVIENIPAMVFVKRAEDLSYELVNKAWEEVLGFKSDDMEGKRDGDFFPQAQADFFEEKDREVLVMGRMVDIPEESVTTSTGETKVLRTKKLPVMGSDGKPEYVLGISEDISGQRKNEEELFKLRRAIESSGDAVLMTTIEGEITYVNPAFERMYGFSQDEVLGKNPRILQSGHQDKKFYQRLWTGLKANKRQTLEMVNKRKDGTKVTIESSLTPVLGKDGKPMAFLAIQRDITAKKQIEAKLKKRNEEMETLNKLMVGRELKMVELKKVIGELRSKVSPGKVEK